MTVEELSVSRQERQQLAGMKAEFAQDESESDESRGKCSFGYSYGGVIWSI